MPQTVEADYHDGIVHLKRKPVGIKRSKALVVFLDDVQDEEEHRTVDLDKVKKKKSSVDRWIGVIEGAELGDWKAERGAAIEDKPR
jgi:hypothetical protein